MSINSSLESAVLSGAQPVKTTYEQFLDWHPDGQIAEWVAGEAFVMTAPSTIHERESKLLFRCLSDYVDAHELGEMFSAPFPMKLGDTAREPDLLFVAAANLARVEKKYLNGPADMVIEIVGPESRGRDRGEKFYEHEEAGIPEYWLIDPMRKQSEFYTLGGDGTYRLMPISKDGIFHSHVLKGLWLDVNWFAQDPLPKKAAILKAWGLT
jgi:Uma2 family endonuclease